MTAFDLPSGTNNFDVCVMNALESSDRESLIECLAAYRVVPVKNNFAGTPFQKAIAKLERRGDTKPNITNGTRNSILSVLGITEEHQIEQVREKIKHQPNWGEQA